jgi:response regulator RpfG family c-di-GMP phosphodiesterase
VSSATALRTCRRCRQRRGRRVGASEAVQADPILLDLNMPGMDGFETARKLRQTPSAALVLILAVSGYVHDNGWCNRAIGGADTLDNIWPQCGPSRAEINARYFTQKDLVENWLADEVPARRMTLAAAQNGIASDWTQYQKVRRMPVRVSVQAREGLHDGASALAVPSVGSVPATSAQNLRVNTNARSRHATPAATKNHL